MSKLFIISDCHGNIEGLNRALVKKKIIDNHGHRQLPKRHKVFSIGDLANCTKTSIEGDLACLYLVGNVIDGMLVGNHEMPYIDINDDFAGFHRDASIGAKIRDLWELDFIGSSIVAGQTLITHAGVSKQFLPMVQTAVQVHEMLESHWVDQDWNYSLFASVGYARTGRDHVGGMLWCDFDAELIPTSFSQIVGHTPKYVRMKGNALCIDVGAKDQETEPFILEIS